MIVNNRLPASRALDPAVRVRGALGLILCRLRAMLQGYLFMHFSCLQEPPKTSLKQFKVNLKVVFPIFFAYSELIGGITYYVSYVYDIMLETYYFLWFGSP